MKAIIEWFKNLFSSGTKFAGTKVNGDTGEAKSSLRDYVLRNNPNIKAQALDAALKWKDHTRVTNNDYIVLVDFSISEKFDRAFLINMETGAVDAQKVAHGKNSDKNKDGITDSFSNVSGSFESSLGAMIIGGSFTNPKWKFVRLMEGLEKGLNDNVKKREILWHSTTYVNDLDGQSIGDTLGCFGVSEAVAAKWNDKLNGVLLYAWHPSLSPTKASETPKIPLKGDRIALSWEKTDAPHPERIPWSDQIIKELKEDIDLFTTATDVTEIHPKFKQMNEMQQLKTLGEFFVALAYYECGYNPKSYSVDVGNANNKETWSVGLYQMSGTDSSAKVFNANFKTLQDPIVNIKVAMEQFRRQLKARGKFFLQNSDSRRYWATLLIGNKYSKIAQIRDRVIARVGV